MRNRITDEVKKTAAEKQRGVAVSEKLLALEAELIKVRAEIRRSEVVRSVTLLNYSTVLCSTIR